MENELDVIETTFVDDVLQPESVIINNNTEYIEYLQGVIKLLQAHPEMERVHTKITLWVHYTDKLPDILKMLGSYRKEYSEYTFSAYKAITQNYDFVVQTSRNNVCTEKIVGKKVVEKEVYNALSPEDQKLLDELRAKQYVKRMVEEPIKEWDCNPITSSLATPQLIETPFEDASEF